MERGLKALNSVLSDTTKYQNEGNHLKSWVEKYVEEKVK